MNNSKTSLPTLEAIYNQEYEFLVLRADIISIEPSQPYRLVITWESCNGSSEITPTITLPSKKGWIKSKSHTNSFMLSTCNNANHPTCEIEFLSELGYIDISFHCKITDYRNVPYWGSSKILRKTGMKKEVISETKHRYFCVDNDSGDFDCYVFSVEWVKTGGH